MNEADFNQSVDELMFSIEESIDDSGADIDYENSAGMLTLTCENNQSQIIISRQPVLREVWVAAVSGGFHFKLENHIWQNTVTGESLSTMLNEVFSAQANENINFIF
jgi:CyaY protein